MAITENDTIEVKLKPVLLPEDIDKNVKKIEARLRELEAYQDRLEKGAFDRRTKAGRAQKAQLAEIAREQAKLTPVLQQQIRLYDQISTKVQERSRIEATANANRRMGIQQNTGAVVSQNTALKEQVKLMGALTGASREQARIDAQRAAIAQTANANRTMGIQTPSASRSSVQNIASDIAQTNALTAAISNQTKAVSHQGEVVSSVASKRAVYYAALFAAIYGVSNQLGEAIRFTTEYDKVLLQLQAAVGLTAKQAGSLREEMVQLSITYGEQFQNISAVALELGRAGVGYTELGASIKAVNQLAILTGDTIDSSTRAIVSFVQVFNRDNTGQVVMTVEEIGAKLAYMANQSRLATQDINTLGNYALGAAKSMGMTIDQVNALSIAMSNTGRNASTIGTNIRRFTTILGDQTTQVQEFFQQIGVNQETLRRRVAQGGAESNKAFEEFIQTLGSFSQESLNTALAGMNILTRDTLQSISNSSDQVLKELRGSLAVTSNEIDQADLVTQSLERRFQALANKFYEATEEYITPALHTILSGMEKMGALIGAVSEQLERLAATGVFIVLVRGLYSVTAATSELVIRTTAAAAATAAATKADVVHTAVLDKKADALSRYTALSMSAAKSTGSMTAVTTASTAKGIGLIGMLKGVAIANPWTTAALTAWTAWEAISAIAGATSDVNDEVDKLQSKQYTEKSVATSKARFSEDSNTENYREYSEQLKGLIENMDKLSRSRAMSRGEQEKFLDTYHKLTRELRELNRAYEAGEIKVVSLSALQKDQQKRYEGTAKAIEIYNKNLKVAQESGATERVEQFTATLKKLQEQLISISEEDVTTSFLDPKNKTEKVFTIFKDDMRKQVSEMTTSVKKIMDSGNEALGNQLLDRIEGYLISDTVTALDELNRKLKSIGLDSVELSADASAQEASMKFGETMVALLSKQLTLKEQLATASAGEVESLKVQLETVNKTIAPLELMLDATASLAKAKANSNKSNKDSLRDARNRLAIAKLNIDLEAEKAKYLDENTNKALEEFDILKERAGLDKKYNDNIKNEIASFEKESERRKAQLQWELDKEKALSALRGKAADASRELVDIEMSNKQKDLDVKMLDNQISASSTILDLAKEQYGVSLDSLKIQEKSNADRRASLIAELKSTTEVDRRKIIKAELAKLTGESLKIDKEKLQTTLALKAAEQSVLEIKQKSDQIGLGYDRIAITDTYNSKILESLDLMRELEQLQEPSEVGGTIGSPTMIADKELELEHAKLDIMREQYAMQQAQIEASLQMQQSVIGQLSAMQTITESQKENLAVAQGLSEMASISYTYGVQYQALQTTKNALLVKEDGLQKRINAKKSDGVSTAKDEVKLEKVQGQLQAVNGEEQVMLANLSANAFGAVAGALKEGSNEQKAFLILQQTATLVAAQGAIAMAGMAPGPAGLASALAMAAYLASVGIIIAGGGGGGGSAQADPNETRLKELEDSSAPMLERLDEQISLLEKIERNGSASQASLTKSLYEFNLNMEKNALESASKYGGMIIGYESSSLGIRNMSKYREIFRDLGDELVKEFGFDADPIYAEHKGNRDRDLYLRLGDMINSSNDLLTYIANRDEIEKFAEDFVMGRGAKYYLEYQDSLFTQEQFEAMMHNAQTIIYEFANSIGDSVSDMVDAKNSFESIFDQITGIPVYETQRLKEAMIDVNKLAGGTDTNSVSEYLKKQIENIKLIEDEYDLNAIELLSSIDPKDIEAQSQLVLDLQKATDNAFKGGAEDALNYLESIELVGSSMAAIASERASLQQTLDLLTGVTTQREVELEALDESNRVLQERIWLLDEEKGLQEAVFNLIASENEQREKTLNSLDASNRIYQEFIYDIEDAQKAIGEALNTQKKELDDFLKDVVKSISRLESALKSLGDVIDKLRGESRTADQNLNLFYASMSKAKSLVTGNVEEYSEAIADAISRSSVLFETSNFQTRKDMDFAQLAAAAQFEELENATLDQLDYLKMIEENTRGTMLGIEDAIRNLGKTMSDDFQSVIDSVVSSRPEYSNVVEEAYKEAGVTPPNQTTPPKQTTPTVNNTSKIQSAFSAVLGRQAQEEGLNYWGSYLETRPNTSDDALKIAVARGASTTADVKNAIAYLAATTPASGFGQALGGKAVDNGLLERSDFIRMLYQYGLKKSPDPSGFAYWLEDRKDVSGAQLPNAFARGAEVAGQTYNKFDVGGYTGDGSKYDPAGIVHRGEFVINKDNTAKLGLNQNMGNVFDSMLYELRQLKQENQEIKNYMVKLTADNSRQLQTQRALLAESLPA